MKTIAGKIFTILMIGMTSVLGAQNMNTSPENTKNVIFSLGERASENYFKGNAWVSPLVPKEEVFNCSIYNVR